MYFDGLIDREDNKARSKPPKNKQKVWNEILVEALRSRSIVARQNGKRNAISYEQAAISLEAVRKDIYFCKNFIETSRIVNFPSNSKHINKTIEVLCRKIILGTEPTYPHGYVPTTTAISSTVSRTTTKQRPTPLTPTISHRKISTIRDDEIVELSDLSRREFASTSTPILLNERGNDQNVRTHDDNNISDNNPYTNDHYLNNIKRRGGAYAILLAFYYSQNKTMVKKQIINVAQRHCDEMMESNFHQGRTFGAWKSIDTLVKHDLITRKNSCRYNANAGGMRSLEPDKFTLTDNGKLFIDALLQRYPDIERNRGTPMAYGNPSGARRNVDFSSPISASSMLFNDNMIDPELKDIKKDLNDWLQNDHTQLGDKKVYNLTKAKRQALHRICDVINERLIQSRSTKMIRHESFGIGRDRKLCVTVLRQTNSFITPTPTKVVSQSPTGSFENHATSNRNSNGAGHVLDPESAQRGITSVLSSRDAAREAALFRQAVHESKLSEKN